MHRIAAQNHEECETWVAASSTLPMNGPIPKEKGRSRKKPSAGQGKERWL